MSCISRDLLLFFQMRYKFFYLLILLNCLCLKLSETVTCLVLVQDRPYLFYVCAQWES